jgi:hypothetical protein
MTCRKVRSYLSTYSEGLLPAEKLSELEVHIRNCKSCEREKFYLEEIQVAARSLPAKSVPEDFNLQLLNRIYAEQHHPTESYLPAPTLSWIRRPVGWISTAATAAVAVLLTFVFIQQSAHSPVMPQDDPSYSQAENVGSTAATGRHLRQHVPANLYENVIGVSGSASNYRATNVSQVKSLRLADAKVESLYIETMKRLGIEVMTPTGSLVNADSRYFDMRSPFIRPRSSSSTLMRNAASTTSY